MSVYALTHPNPTTGSKEPQIFPQEVYDSRHNRIKFNNSTGAASTCTLTEANFREDNDIAVFLSSVNSGSDISVVLPSVQDCDGCRVEFFVTSAAAIISFSASALAGFIRFSPSATPTTVDDAATIVASNAVALKASATGPAYVTAFCNGTTWFIYGDQYAIQA
jgi:hypothetical protein